MDNTLRKALWGFLRPLVQLLTNLLSPEVGREWEYEFKKFLRKEHCWVRPYQLYLAPGQKDNGEMSGVDLERHLKDTGLVNLCFSGEDELVKSWIRDPSTFPEELKKRTAFLWKTYCDDGSRRIGCLDWHPGLEKVLIRWIPIRGNNKFGYFRPALLKPAA